jgi:hypothetical protein
MLFDSTLEVGHNGIDHFRRKVGMGFAYHQNLLLALSVKTEVTCEEMTASRLIRDIQMPLRGSRKRQVSFPAR